MPSRLAPPAPGLLLSLTVSVLPALVMGCQGGSGRSVEISRALRAEAAQSTAAGRQGFAAPGTIEPLEGITTLAAPLTASGLAPRVAVLYVKEGDRVQAGQILARFDNYPSVLQELAAEDTTIRSLQSEIVILQRQTRRFQKLEAIGVIPTAEYEDRELRLSQLRNKLVQSQARRNVIGEQLRLARLVAPVSGLVLSIHSHAGEQPGTDGVLDLADPRNIGAIAQVEEQYIPRLRQGQAATVNSENGYFQSPLKARVLSIGHRVTTRRALITKPGISKDMEPRVVNVKLAFINQPPSSLANMSGAKVMVNFLQP